MTDPDNLGPVDPGTAVKLQGVVYHETEKGEFVNFPLVDPSHSLWMLKDVLKVDFVVFHD